MAIGTKAFRAVCIAVLAILAPAMSFAQDAGKQIELRYRIVSERSVFYANWASLSDLKNSGSPTEDWLGQSEIQQMLKKLFESIKNYQQDNPVNDELLNEILIKAPKVLHDCPGTFHLTGFDAAHPSWKYGAAVAAIELKQHEDLAIDGIERMIRENQEKADSVREHVWGDVTMRSVKYGEGDGRFYFGIVQGNLICTIGEVPIEETLANLKTAAPSFTNESREKLGVERPFLSFFASTNELLNIWKENSNAKRDAEPAKKSRFFNVIKPATESYNVLRAAISEGKLDSLKLDEITSVSASFGLEKSGFIFSLLLECPEDSTGIVSVFNGQPLDKDYLADMPGDAIYSAGASLHFANIFEQFKAKADGAQAKESLANRIEAFENLTGLKFSEEILDSFEGNFFTYQKIINPGVISLQVKNKEQFAKRLETCLESLRTKVNPWGEFHKLSKREYDNCTIYSVGSSRRYSADLRLSWCHDGDQFYLGGDYRQIQQYLRQRGRTQGRLINEKRLKEMFEFGDAKGWGKPVLFSHVDSTTATQLLIPLAQSFFGRHTVFDGFDFKFNDVPSVEVLANGVGANVLAMFRAPQGIRIVEKSTVPGLTALGYNVRVLLPELKKISRLMDLKMAMNKLERLQHANLEYESAHGHFPAAYSVDASDQPLLSWRVHVLPFLDQKKLYEKFNLDEPWNSPHNIKLLDEMPEVFRDRGAKADSQKTTFLGVAGEHGVFPGSTGLKRSDIEDGFENTIAIVDAATRHAVNWTQPADFDPADHKHIFQVIKGDGVFKLVVALDSKACLLRTVRPGELHRSDGKGNIDEMKPKNEGW